MKKKEDRKNSLLERLAELEHDQWASWTDHFLDKVYRQNPPDKEAIRRWERQIKTPYEELSEEEKEADRKWARRIIDKCLLIIGKEGTVYINVNKKVTKRQLKKIIEVAEELYGVEQKIEQ